MMQWFNSPMMQLFNLPIDQFVPLANCSIGELFHWRFAHFGLPITLAITTAPGPLRPVPKRPIMKYWIGTYLREMRRKKGFTQTQLGNIIGRGQAYMSNLENAKRDPGFHETLLALHATGAKLPEVNGLKLAVTSEPQAPEPAEGQ
jgi:DNA-binding XRE family transcriptional regulator